MSMVLRRINVPQHVMPTEQNEQLLEELKQKILVLIFLQKQVKQEENVLFSLRKKEFWKKK